MYNTNAFWGALSRELVPKNLRSKFKPLGATYSCGFQPIMLMELNERIKATISVFKDSNGNVFVTRRVFYGTGKEIDPLCIHHHVDLGAPGAIEKAKSVVAEQYEFILREIAKHG